MRVYTKEEAKARINFLANAGKPFVFIINYKQDGSYIEETNRINTEELRYNLNGYTNCQNITTSRERGIVLFSGSLILLLLLDITILSILSEEIYWQETVSSQT